METLVIFLSLGLLMFFAYKGFSVILFAPVFALMAAVVSGLHIMPTYTEVFMPTMVAFVKNFFPLFMLGAIFGKLMEDSGSAKRIANFIVDKIGAKHAVMAVMSTCVILAYGGVSVHVISFAVYPLAAALFKEANIPKRVIPACIAFGGWSIAMDALPGTPQIQNLIPTKYLGTDAYAAPMTGIIAAIILWFGGWYYLQWQAKQLMKAGEGYGTGHKNEPDPNLAMNTKHLPSLFVAMAPLLIVLIGNYIFTQIIKTWNPDILAGVKTGVSLASVTSIWALIIALSLAIVVTLIMNRGRFFYDQTFSLANCSHIAVMGSLLAIMNTASEVGYGNVIALQQGFKNIQEFLMTIHVGNSPLVSEAIMINVIAGITGSASGGIGIAMDLMGKTYLDWGNAVGISPQIIHRIASLASGGMDTLPHNGAVITLLAICGLTHRESYKFIFVLTIFKTAVAFLMVALVTLFPFIC